MQNPTRTLVRGLARPSNYPVGSTPEWGPSLGRQRERGRVVESNVDKKNEKRGKRITASRWWGSGEKNSLISRSLSSAQCPTRVYTSRPSPLRASPSRFLPFFCLPRRKVGSALIIVNQTREWCAERGGTGGCASVRLLLKSRRTPGKSGTVKRRYSDRDREISTDRVTTRRYFFAALCPARFRGLREGSRWKPCWPSGVLAKFLLPIIYGS